MSIPDPIEEQDWICTPVKVILYGKGHGEVGFTVHAA